MTELEDRMLDIEAVRRICPPCAESMAFRNIKMVRRSAIAKQLADAIKVTFGVPSSEDGNG